MKVNDLKSQTHSQLNSVDVDLGQYAHIIRIDIILHCKETNQTFYNCAQKQCTFSLHSNIQFCIDFLLFHFLYLYFPVLS